MKGVFEKYVLQISFLQIAISCYCLRRRRFATERRRNMEERYYSFNEMSKTCDNDDVYYVEPFHFIKKKLVNKFPTAIVYIIISFLRTTDLLFPLLPPPCPTTCKPPSASAKRLTWKRFLIAQRSTPRRNWWFQRTSNGWTTRRVARFGDVLSPTTQMYVLLWRLRKLPQSRSSVTPVWWRSWTITVLHCRLF